MIIPDDVLLLIFSLNAPQDPLLYSTSLLERLDYWDHSFDSASQDSLITAIATSQVCREWRELMLSSPDIWAKSVNFNTLDRFCDPLACVQEILTRAERSPIIWVYGKISRSEMMEVFLEVVQQCWIRIELLHVDLVVFYLCPDEFDDFADHTAWNRIRHEISPALRFFKTKTMSTLNIHEGSPYTIPSVQNRNTQYLHMQVATAERLDTPLFQHLRYLDLEHIELENLEHVFVPWKIGRLFELLKATPLLEALRIGERVAETLSAIQFGHEQKNKIISLPQLRCIDLTCDVFVCLSILLGVKPAPQCSFRLRVCMTELNPYPANQLAQLQELILKAARDVNFSSSIALRLSPTEPAILYTNSRQDVGFELEFNTFTPNRPLCFPFFDAFLAKDDFNFTNVAFLDINTTFPEDFEPYPPRIFQIVMAKFTHLQTLKTGWDYFDVFLDKLISTGGVPSSSQFLSSDIFPELKSLVLERQLRIHQLKWEKPLRAIVDFCKLHRRSQASHGSWNLKLDLCDLGADEDVNFILPLLNILELEGLQVEVRDRVDNLEVRKMAVCGSGQVEALKVNMGITRDELTFWGGLNFGSLESEVEPDFGLLIDIFGL